MFREFVVLALLGAMLGCGDDGVASVRCQGDLGTLGCECRATAPACVAALECLSGLCVREAKREDRSSDASSASGDAGAAGPSGNAGTTGAGGDAGASGPDQAPDAGTDLASDARTPADPMDAGRDAAPIDAGPEGGPPPDSAADGGSGGSPCAVDNGGCGDPKFYSCSATPGGSVICRDVNQCLNDNGGCGDPAAFSCENNAGALPTCSNIDDCTPGNVCGGEYPCVDGVATYSCLGLFPEWSDVDDRGPFSTTADTVTDTHTKLVWQRAPAANSYGQAAAVSYCAGLGLAGSNDWRLPSVMELLSIVKEDTYNPAIDLAAFPATPSASFWTRSTRGDDSTSAYFVAFGAGGVAWTKKTTLGRVRCVR